MTQTAKTEARPPVQDWEEGKSFPRGREGVWEGSRLMKGQTQTPVLSSEPAWGSEGGGVPYPSERLSRVTVMMVSFWLKGTGTVANTASCLVSVSALQLLQRKWLLFVST